METYRVALCDDNADQLKALELLLPRLGFTVVSCADNGVELIRQVVEGKPDVALVDLMMPAPDGIETAVLLAKQSPVAVVLMSGAGDAGELARANPLAVHCFAPKPLESALLGAYFALAVSRFQEQQKVDVELRELRERLEDGKTVRLATLALMRLTGLPEPDAYKRLQRSASEQRIKLAEAARRVLALSSIVRDGQGGK